MALLFERGGQKNVIMLFGMFVDCVFYAIGRIASARFICELVRVAVLDSVKAVTML